MAIFESGWIPIVGGTDYGANVETKLDTAFTNIDTFMTESIALRHFVPVYEYILASDVTITNDVYQEVCNLTTASLPAGTYQMSLATIYSLNSTTSSAFFRFSTDGGVTWTEASEEPKDITDKRARTVVLVDVFVGGVKNIIIQARKEVAGDVMVLDITNIIYERKI